MKVYDMFQRKTSQMAVLIDPDKPSDDEIRSIASLAVDSAVDYFFVGGSLLTNNNLESCIKILKYTAPSIPVVLFPGNGYQLSSRADAFLFLSLISGRNPEMLIGRHVVAAPYLKMSGLEILPVGYMIIESGRATSVSYMSNSTPIPSDKNDIAICTAMAGEMLGLKVIFMDAGSGALHTIPERMIAAVKGSIEVPLIIGGGIRTPEKAASVAKAGANIIVIGNAFENAPELMPEFAQAIHAGN
ncbi:MAG: geranylgeranylglyceryl/heptaprenylglyceryl phosphate synthase [Bacteroidales bacterium]|nr:geranylgeranylglyceryl/heptaprenylglyceryl phosphate synthase [Bacteroidales bacterium]MCK9447815.1 geranylgeranylglyceryl/heptaprenylglyceryl phosphate synthase [Bacteroidales bacterium]MDD3700077.1 geranylgeranylglyceryl/heptaprenylglyceryl phosphate synthase [Bacteroidales bacterium]MDY0368849.1 geranylgeranylglyceryl/heptaprenylglyceryl phosphate synthase [Bacteroidales bacterium]